MKILSIILHTDSLAGTEAFYRDALELPVAAQDENSITFRAGYSTLTFISSVNEDPVYHFAFNIPCNKLRQAMGWVSARMDLIPVSGANPIADFSNWHAAAFYFYDNNGNILEFIARNDLHNESQVPFSSASIVSISETGIVTDDVAGFCRQMAGAHGLQPFARQPQLEHFAALGDDEGLLIVSDAGRHWYPTEQTAAKHFLEVKFLLNGEVKEIRPM